MRTESALIYLDNAATSWPKPPEVIEAVTQTMMYDGANPGRGSHAMAVRASRVLFDTRKQLAKLFHIKNPNDIAFTSNTTMALNMAIKGFLRPGDHVIATSIEHNSVRRPLYELQQKLGIEVTYIPSDEEGNINIAALRASVQKNTALLIVNHSSNLLGTILPLEQLADIAKKNQIKLLVDAAQSAGLLSIDVQALGIDMMAFPGHKGLMGPQGTGGLYIAPDVELEPLLHGGTGSQSETPQQPTVRPDRYEAGTQNTSGLAGLKAGVEYINKRSVEAIGRHEWSLSQRIIEGLMRNNDVRVLGPALGKPRTGIVSFTVNQIEPSEMSFILDQHYQIAVRSGFHCTPLAHEIAKTDATGAIRASVGAFSTEKEADQFIAAVNEITKQYFKL